jgi:iron complex transport system substrate-binding protein
MPYFERKNFVSLHTEENKEMKPMKIKFGRSLVITIVLSTIISACSLKSNQSSTDNNKDTGYGSSTNITVKYATGFCVRDTAGIRLVDVGEKYHFALVSSVDAEVPDGYTKVHVPVKSTICMTALQLSNFTILDAHDVVKGLTGTKNLFNQDILDRVNDGRIVKIGMEGNFDTEMVLAANPDIIFISPSKRGGYDAIKETGITLVPHLGYQELNPLGQAEWIKFVSMFIGKEKEANEVFAGIENRYNDLKSKVQRWQHRVSSVVRCIMETGTLWAERIIWHRFSVMLGHAMSSMTRRLAVRIWNLKRCIHWLPMLPTGVF